MSPVQTSEATKIKELEQALASKEKELQQVRADTDEFLHLASHDLQAPLRKLDTFVDRLLGKLADQQSEDIKQYTTRIQSIIGQTREMIDGLATLAAISTPQHSTTNLNTIVEQLIKEKQLKSGQVVTDDLSDVSISTEHLKMIMEQLLDNSIKFKIQDRDLQVHITAKPLPSAANMTEISYTDNGMGIETDQAEAIFKPFVRLHGSHFSGPGLGLAIVKKIVSLYNGTICVSSTVEPGARFVIHLPASAQHAES